MIRGIDKLSSFAQRSTMCLLQINFRHCEQERDSLIILAHALRGSLLHSDE